MLRDRFTTELDYLKTNWSLVADWSATGRRPVGVKSVPMGQLSVGNLSPFLLVGDQSQNNR